MASYPLTVFFDGACPICDLEIALTSCPTFTEDWLERSLLSNVIAYLYGTVLLSRSILVACGASVSSSKPGEQCPTDSSHTETRC